MKDQYLLQDGTYADPKDCSKGKDGVLRHKNGVGVAMTEAGEPMTLSKATEHNQKAAEAGAGVAPAGEPLATTETVAPKPADDAGKDKPAV